MTSLGSRIAATFDGSAHSSRRGVSLGSRGVSLCSRGVSLCGRGVLPRAKYGAALAMLLLLSACGKPRQLGGPIAVNTSGLEGRIDAFCRLQDPGAPPGERNQCLAEPLD